MIFLECSFSIYHDYRLFITLLYLCACILSHHFQTTDMNNVQVRQRFINLNDDLKRHQWMIRFHAIDGALFLIRFIILCAELSAAVSNKDSSDKSFLWFIFLFELLGSLSVLLANILYSCMVYASRMLYETDNDDIPYCPRKPLLRLSTLTCFTCDCYYEHPYAVLLTRIGILSVCLLLRFIAFILGAAYTEKHNSGSAIAYTIFAALSFLPSIPIMILEYRHHRRLWNFFPDGNELAPRSRRHLQFMSYSIINDQRTSSWRSSLCKRPACTSRNLYHILLYHSGSTQYRDNNHILIGFHQTDQTAAFAISQTGFVKSNRGMLGPGVYFATCIEHTEFKANHRGAYICARINVGRVRKTKNRYDPADTAAGCDTIYFEHPHGSDEFCVKEANRIEEWIIVVNQDESVRRPAANGRDNIQDRFYGETYVGCIF